MSLFSPSGLQSSLSSSSKKKPTAASAWPSESPSHATDSNDTRLTPMNIELSQFALEEQQQDSNYSSFQPPRQQSWQHLYVLPVLWLEFLALALTRAVLPHILLEHFQHKVYIVMGLVEFIRGLLAFVSCPLFGKLSDVVGRRMCLFVTVAGTCAPVCSLALLSWEQVHPTATGSEKDMMALHDNMTSAILSSASGQEESPGADAADVWPMSASWMLDSSDNNERLMPHSISIFVVLLALSGVFSSTFTLVFAYISDTVRQRDERVSAYGLALATFGLSFTMGPMMGGYLAQYNTRYVFLCSLVLTLLDLLYIYFVLPESRTQLNGQPIVGSAGSVASSLQQHNVSWSPLETLRIFTLDPFLKCVGQVAFLYYTALWAVISTLVLYAAQRFHLGPERLGELMSALGLSTMVSEAVLVRIIVPMLGEKRAMRLGLFSFALQCIVLGFAYEGWHLFVCIAFSLLGNLVYPSLSSLVSDSVEPEAVGEALGAVNGIKALTEGIGPLVFGTLMTLSEKSALPGWPYLLAAAIVYMAYQASEQLPDAQSEDYIHELERKGVGRTRREFAPFSRPDEEYEGLLDGDEDDEGDMMVRMLSEVEESEDEAEDSGRRLPVTFAMLASQSK